MRLKLQISGLVQGVGFRPFVYRLAQELGLKGYVLNDTAGVLIEVEGERPKLDSFLARINNEKPDISKIFSLQHAFLEETGFTDFEIRDSREAGDRKASILPDIAACKECLDEAINPKDRRFIYPFINCTNCGPRFTIIETLPYDRKNTSMKKFGMCATCENEYNMPSDRRFHAQPDACSDCGPWLSLFDCESQLICEKEEALEKTVNLIRKGYIIAVKGIGGYHLICDATSDEAVSRLRKRKNREEKPMAVMFQDMDSIKNTAYINKPEERAITSIERPIVIVRKKEKNMLADSISPDNSTVGVFLPYTPLHYLLLRKIKIPIVATSANLTDDPIVMDEKDAFARLSKIADFYLTHNREIVRRCDDSVVRIMAERQVPLRRSRGFAPLPVTVPFTFNKPVLALGPYMNNTIALGIDNKVYLSQHIGDLDTPLAMEFYKETVNDFLRLFSAKPAVVVSDMHPGYYSTKFGEENFQDSLIRVQHHYAHILSCITENDLPENTEVIGFAFDGTGYGTDNTIWGGEVLVASYREFKRVLHLKPFRLPGGDKAVKEPCRTAFSLLYETIGDLAQETELLPYSKQEKVFFTNMLSKNINSPVTTSMGRLFDGVASLIGLRHELSYHAQAAVLLEQIALQSKETGSYSYTIENGIINQLPIIKGIADDLKEDVSADIIAKKFHNTIINIIITAAKSLRDKTGIKYVALSGGVFQNTLLLESSFKKLVENGFIPLIHQLVPPNDGGISLGQAAYGLFH